MLSTKFPIVSDGSELSAMLLMPEGPGPHPTVILLHGFPGFQKNYDIAHALRLAGYNAIIFSYRGCWGSEGSYKLAHVLEDASATLSRLMDDKTASKYRLDRDAIFLIGHSMGGWCGLMTAAHRPEVKAVAALATFNVGYFSEQCYQNREFKSQLIKAIDVLGTEPLSGTSAQQLADEIESHYEMWDPRKFTEQLKGLPIYMIGAMHDIEAPKDPHHDAIVNALVAAGHDQLIESVLDTDHGFSDKREAIIRELIAWLDGLMGRSGRRKGAMSEDE